MHGLQTLAALNLRAEWHEYIAAQATLNAALDAALDDEVIIERAGCTAVVRAATWRAMQEARDV